MFTQEPPPVTCFLSGESHWLSSLFGGRSPADATKEEKAIARDFAAFEYSLFHLKKLETQHGLFTLFAPEGNWSWDRKSSSYIGGIRTPWFAEDNNYMTALRDPGNYVYGLILRSTAPHTFDASHYSDVMLGDIIEATLGLAWQLHFGTRSAHDETAQLTRKYFLVIERAVLECEKVLRHTAGMGIWTHSRALTLWFVPGDRANMSGSK
jgi:hypothetical protein